jgi:hypothetical protein
MNESLLSAIIGAAATLAGLTVTLVTIVPVLIDAIQSRGGDIFAAAESRYRLKSYIRMLVYAIGAFTVSCVAALVGLLSRSATAQSLAISMFCLGLLVVAMVTALIAHLTHSVT